MSSRGYFDAAFRNTDSCMLTIVKYYDEQSKWSPEALVAI